MCATSRKYLDGIWAHHAALTQQLQDYADRDTAEKASMLAESKALLERAELAEQKARHVELVEQEKDWLALENLSLQRQVTSLQQEAENQWPVRKKEFLKSPEFKVFCSDKALTFFEKSFQGCLDQFRVNGYSEADHPAVFLDVDKALQDLPENGEVSGTEEDAREEGEPKSNSLSEFSICNFHCNGTWKF